MAGVRIALGDAPTMVCGCISDRFCIGLYIQWYIYMMSAVSAYLYIVFIRCIRDPVSRCWVGQIPWSTVTLHEVVQWPLALRF